MWLCETKPQESIIKIGQTLKRRLGIDDKVVSFSNSGFLLLIEDNHLRFFLDLNATMIQLTKLGPRPRASTQSSGMERTEK